MCEAYSHIFIMPVRDQDKPWAPHFTCEHCKKTLEGWYREKKRAMKFVIPVVWHESTDHSSNCYFCILDLLSSILPVLHSPELPVSTLSESRQPSSEESNKSEEEVDVEDPDYNFRGTAGERNLYYPNQRDLNDLIRDLGLTKSNAKLLTSGLKDLDLLDESVQVTSRRKHHRHFSSFVTCQDGHCFCHNVSGL
ncbi:uncharacterized protein LOC143240821 [Tachypleus tridentatus]|uniref:uncharacterized protein LOC143240821 n=1 Tax=Tachypleus tridentatus TaxID=6853 RepID=UPI003FD6856D